ncbi:hypothetical protein HYY69_02920 [Candidatus Woesearchaeota archaeon]|nr:hypothetical protein [Candidatus Woesearchaeota archaeon]
MVILDLENRLSKEERAYALAQLFEEDRKRVLEQLSEQERISILEELARVRRLTEEDKADILNELVRVRRKRAIGDFYKNHGRIEDLWGLLYLDSNLFYRLVEQKVGTTDALFSSRNSITLRGLLKFNPELFGRVLDERRKQLKVLLGEPEERNYADQVAESSAVGVLFEEEKTLDSIVQAWGYNEQQKYEPAALSIVAVDDLCPDFERTLDSALKEMVALNPSRFIELLSAKLYLEDTDNTDNSMQLSRMYQTLPYLAKLTATEVTLPYEPKMMQQGFLKRI